MINYHYLCFTINFGCAKANFFEFSTQTDKLKLPWSLSFIQHTQKLDKNSSILSLTDTAR